MTPFEIWLTEKYGEGNTARGYAQDVGRFCGGYHNSHSPNRATRARLRAQGRVV